MDFYICCFFCNLLLLIILSTKKFNLSSDVVPPNQTLQLDERKKRLDIGVKRKLEGGESAGGVSTAMGGGTRQTLIDGWLQADRVSGGRSDQHSQLEERNAAMRESYKQSVRVIFSVFWGTI